jgi:hypothetical protein
LAALLALFALPLLPKAAAQAAQPQPPGASTPLPTLPLPDAPKPQKIVHDSSTVGPCRVVQRFEPEGAVTAFNSGEMALELAGFPSPTASSGLAQSAAPAELPPCPPQPLINWFARFLTGPEVKPLSPKEKARLALRNLLDPFNAITILGNSAITVASDAQSPYGPGMPGFARNVGVSFTQDLTGEFFGTFLIPSIVHQDPHYHRMPNATIRRRIGHAILQVVWTQGDNGEGMINYANLVGYAIDDEISNLYVPGRHTNLPSSSARYGIGIATSPIDNFITEFLPDVARHIHVQVVIVQRVIDQVAKTDDGGGS